MTQVYYFGTQEHEPVINTTKNLSNIIKRVNFEPKTLATFPGKDPEEIEFYKDYVDLILRIGKEKNITLKKLTCGHK